jgi:hypothetical protein
MLTVLYMYLLKLLNDWNRFDLKYKTSRSLSNLLRTRIPPFFIELRQTDMYLMTSDFFHDLFGVYINFLEWFHEQQRVFHLSSFKVETDFWRTSWCYRDFYIYQFYCQYNDLVCSIHVQLFMELNAVWCVPCWLLGRFLQPDRDCGLFHLLCQNIKFTIYKTGTLYSGPPPVFAPFFLCIPCTSEEIDHMLYSLSLLKKRQAYINVGKLFIGSG